VAKTSLQKVCLASASSPLHRPLTNLAAVLHKINIINDHVADEKEDFDLNLYPTNYQKEAVSAGASDTASIKSGAPLSRVNTRTSIVDSLWSRKASTAPAQNQLDTSPSLHRTSTWRSELSRTDSVVEEAPIEEENEPWSEGLSDFKVDREEDYLSPDF
jgi:hypothetical protein